MALPGECPLLSPGERNKKRFMKEERKKSQAMR
jgi:hypothetical protein